MSTAVSNVTVIDSAKLFLFVTGNDNLSIVDFYTDWCGPCKRIAPVMEEMASKNSDVKFYKINAEYPDPSIQKVVKACDVTSYPTFCFFKSSKCIKKVEGANAAAIEQAIKELK